MAEVTDLEIGTRKRLISAGTSAATRIYWGERPQGGALPDMTLNTISDARPSHLKGLDGARGTRVQCDCRAKSFKEAKALVTAAIATMQPPATVDGKRFGNAQVEGPRSFTEKAPDGTSIHRQSVDFIIWHVGD